MRQTAGAIPSPCTSGSRPPFPAGHERKWVWHKRPPGAARQLRDGKEQRAECGQLSGGPYVVSFREARMWSAFGRPECGQLSGGSSASYRAKMSSSASMASSFVLWSVSGCQRTADPTRSVHGGHAATHDGPRPRAPASAAAYRGASCAGGSPRRRARRRSSASASGPRRRAPAHRRARARNSARRRGRCHRGNHSPRAAQALW